MTEMTHKFWLASASAYGAKGEYLWPEEVLDGPHSSAVDAWYAANFYQAGYEHLVVIQMFEGKPANFAGFEIKTDKRIPKGYIMTNGMLDELPPSDELTPFEDYLAMVALDRLAEDTDENQTVRDDARTASEKIEKKYAVDQPEGPEDHDVYEHVLRPSAYNSDREWAEDLMLEVTELEEMLDDSNLVLQQIFELLKNSAAHSDF